jgi:hypothetical protein
LIISPLAIWSELCKELPAAEKIRMMRLFGVECLDISELNGDGWVVGHNLLASMAYEQTELSETSIHWVYTQNQAELLVALGANSIWNGVQSVVRAFLIEQGQNRLSHNFIRSDQGEDDSAFQSHANAFGYWLALRASERELIPLAVQAAQFLKVNGFDPIPGMGNLGRRDVSRSLPMLYSAWAKTSHRVLGSIKELIETELDLVLTKLSLDREAFALRIQQAAEQPPDHAADSPLVCDECHDDYTKLGTGLVKPLQISFEECRSTQHKFYCLCSKFLQANGVTSAQPIINSADLDDVEIDEEVYREIEMDINDLCKEYDKLDIHDNIEGDSFTEAATLLYRAQGRRWIGEYEDLEVLCATCFLRREQYLGEDGYSGSRLTQVPNTFASSYSPDSLGSTFCT